MSEYVLFTDEQREQARQTDLVAFLRQCGEIVKPSGSEYQWNSNGQKITIRGNVWYNQYEQVGGDAIAFAQCFYSYSYPDAVKLMLAMNCGIANPSYTTYPKEDFSPPARLDNMRRVYAYLIQQRGIDKDVLDAFAYRKLIYESAKYHNAVFVGYDKSGQSRHAHKRGTGSESTYKGNATGSMPEYSFHWVGADDTLFLFEAPVDMLSFITLNKAGWRNHSYAAACSVSDKVLWQCLKDYPYIQQVYICFDNDAAGQEAASRIQEKLQKNRIHCKILVPVEKDWNEDLLYRREEKLCQGKQS